jgi:phosphatidylcholine synthase
MTRARLIAWGVHFYTAVGAVVGLLALEAVARARFGTAFAWMVVAFLLDCTDGTMARRARVKEVVPEFDGARLDDIVDYLNYVFVPVFLALHANLLPEGRWGIVVAALPLLSSGYGFCQASAKTPDHFFTGFPSYWNVVVFYLYVLAAPLWFNVAVLTILSVLVFVPLRYLYPSRGTKFRKRIYLLGLAWGVAVIWLVFQFPAPSRTLAVLSLGFPAYYMGMSLKLHFTSPPSPVRSGSE